MVSPRFRAAVAAGALILATAATGCGTERTAAESTSTAASSATKAAGGGGGAILPISTDLTKKPKIPPPTGQPPEGLVVKDIVTGKGAPAKAGQTLTVQYVGVAHSTGKEFDASWDRGQPFPVKLGTGAVIKGWDEGLVGMKVGGRRELVIPPDLGYGSQGSPPAIAPGETLIFVIDLKKLA